MKTLFGTILIVGMLSGCFVRTRNSHRNEPRRSSSRADCPPSYHWDGGQCVHNGGGRGNGKGRGR